MTSLAPYTSRLSGVEPGVSYRKPYYDVRGESDKYFVRVLMPGVKKDGLNISLDHHTLTIEGSRDRFVKDDWRPILSELDWDDYRLRLELNVKVDEDAIDAHVEDGVLLLTLPKAEEAKPRLISVN